MFFVYHSTVLIFSDLLCIVIKNIRCTLHTIQGDLKLLLRTPWVKMSTKLYTSMSTIRLSLSQYVCLSTMEIINRVQNKLCVFIMDCRPLRYMTFFGFKIERYWCWHQWSTTLVRNGHYIVLRFQKEYVNHFLVVTKTHFSAEWSSSETYKSLK